MWILVACEYSATVRDAFRARGHHAWSVDLGPTEGDPRWHVQGDAVDVAYRRGPWHMMIAFPPCEHLSKAGARYWADKAADGRQARAARFVRRLWNAPIERVAIENPAGWLSTNWRQPTQRVEPYQFGDPWSKLTCLWLRGLPRLRPTALVAPQGPWTDGGRTTGRVYRAPEETACLRLTCGHHRNPRERARIAPGMAAAMAEQWGRGKRDGMVSP